MAVRVVEALEVVHVHHGDAELAAQPRQRLIQGAPPRELGQPVAVRHHVRGFDHRHDEDQARGRQPQLLTGSRGRPRQHREHRGEAVQVAAHRRLRLAEPGHGQQHADGEEGNDRGLLDRGPGGEAGRQQVGRQELETLDRKRPCEKYDAHHLHAEQHPAQQAGRREGAALGQQRDQREVDREQECQGVEVGAVTRCVEAVQEDVFREREQRDREHQPRAIEAPAQQQRGGEDGEREHGRQARGGAPQRRHRDEQCRRDENRHFGHEFGNEAFHRASNGTYQTGKVNCGCRRVDHLCADWRYSPAPPWRYRLGD